MGQDEQTIFGDLNADAFKLFSGSARYFYADLLEHLSEEIFLDAGFAARPDVIETIRSFLRDYKERPNLEDERKEAKSDPSVRANLIYNRLVETGWLVEQKSSYRRLVDMDPAARVLLDFLLDVKSGRLRSYGGEVIQVLSLLESADRDPETRSEALRTAARSSKSFLNHLRGLSAGMRKAEEALAQRRKFGQLFETFFRDYVEKHLIEDYRLLHTTANPFRFRVRILEISDRMLADDYKIDQLASAAVREVRAPTRDAARKAIITDLRRITSVFQNIDEYLDIIEETNRRVEQRIRNTIRFLDSIREANTEVLERVIGKLGASERGDVVPHDAETLTSLPQGGIHLFAERARQAPYVSTPIRKPVKSAALVEYEQAVQHYRERTIVTPDKTEAYLLENMGQRTSIRGSELPIRSLDDFFVFERLRGLEYLSGGVLSDRWDVTLTPGHIENEWISCTDFIVTRR